MDTREIRNLKYANTNNMACVQKRCETGWTNRSVHCPFYKSDVANCPDGHTNGDWTKDFCSNHLADVQGRKCIKKPVDDIFWNELNKEILNNPNPKLKIDIKNQEKLEKEVIDCCKNIDNTSSKYIRCGNYNRGFKQGIDPSKDIYDNSCNEVYRSYCTRSIDNMKNPECIRWCIKNDASCNHKRKEYCGKVVLDDINNKKYDELCACDYKDSVYDDITNNLSTLYNVPKELLAGGRSCYYPSCANNPFKNNQDRCKDLNLVQCIQKINLELNNSKVNDVKVNALNKCSADIVDNKTNVNNNNQPNTPANTPANNGGLCIIL